MAGRDRQVRRFERTATLLVDDVEGADDADVVEEVGVVAGPAAAVDVGDEGGSADRAEDDMSVAEGDVPGGVASVKLDGARATSSSTWAGSRRTLRVDRSTTAPERASRSIARSPRTSTPISARIRSDARWSVSTSSADRISTGR
jgi:hypothetical protein